MKIKYLVFMAIFVAIGAAIWWRVWPRVTTFEKIVEVEMPSPSGKPLSEAIDPQSDLKKALPDMARLLRAGGWWALIQTYSTPEVLAKMDLNQYKKDQDAELAAMPELIKYNDARAQVFDSLKDQTPILNAAGDEARYFYKLPPINDKVDDPKDAPQLLLMHKVNGKWYLGLSDNPR